MGKVDQVLQEIDNLSLAEQQEILYRLSDKLDLLGCLLLSGKHFLTGIILRTVYMTVYDRGDVILVVCVI